MEMQEKVCHACYIYLDTYDAPMQSKENQVSPIFVKHIPFLSEAKESKHDLFILNICYIFK